VLRDSLPLSLVHVLHEESSLSEEEEEEEELQEEESEARPVDWDRSIESATVANSGLHSCQHRE
jgi:hypothetical protein